MEPASNNHSQPSTSRRSSKRSRVVISQSKGGCVTCKTRRVKCDEQKPLCLRCIQGGRLCGGYKNESSSTTSLRPALQVGVQGDSNTQRLSHLASLVLSLDNNGVPLQDGDLWGRVFLQLSNQVECVKAAAVAFGAAYESSLANATDKDSSSTWRYYGSALARLQSDVQHDAARPECMALASIILACVEVLGQQELNAFHHFIGAVQILSRGQQRLLEAGAPADLLDTVRDGLVKVNLLVGSYALSQTPQFMHFDFPETSAGDDVFRDPHLAINAAMLCLYRSYQYIQSISDLRYTYPSWAEYDETMCKAQSDAVRRCREVLNGFGKLVETLQGQYSSATSTLQDSEMLAEVYANRTQLTAALIYIMCIHDCFESAYDEHLDLFRNIVSDAAASARLRRRTKSSAFNRFSTRPGIVSPLFIASMKCRDPPLRALAIAMLKEQSREGPADGQILAAVGARLAAIETSASVPSSPDGTLAASDILEEHRIRGYSRLTARLDEAGRRVVDLILTRPKTPLSQGWGLVDYSCLDGWTQWADSIVV